MVLFGLEPAPLFVIADQFLFDLDDFGLPIVIPVVGGSFLLGCLLSWFCIFLALVWRGCTDVPELILIK